MENLKEDRGVIKFWVFTILTVGIYGIYFWWHVCKDLNTACGYTEETDNDRTPNYIVVCLLGLITIGIYIIYWKYKQGNRMRNAGYQYNILISEGGWSYILWPFFPIAGALIADHLFFSNLNKICGAYNRAAAKQGAGYQEQAGQDTARAPEEDTMALTEMQEGPSTLMPPVIDTGMESTIFCKKGEYAGTEITVRDGEEIILGRDGSQSHLILLNKKISRKHCGIIFQGISDNYVVTDYSSTGVYFADGSRFPKGEPVICERGTLLSLSSGENQFILQ